MPQLECPEPDVLTQWIHGLLPADESETHEQHIAECTTCVEAVSQLSATDALTQSLSAQPTIPADDDGVDDLISRIRQLPETVDHFESLDVDVRSFLEPPEQSDELGRLGDHRVLEPLGTGGMGIVFRAEDTRLQRMVALKVMHPVLSSSRHACRRFMREARAAAAFEHEHVVTIYNVGEDNGLPWLSMHLLHGESLDRRLRSIADDNVTLPVADTLRISREIAEGLSVAHQHGLLHRDIKPDNIWLRDSDDHVTILDFGLARVTDEDSLVTRQGAILGTPDYMSPEQARGDEVDARCDLFSLGCVMYRMATGVSPFARANAMATLNAVTHETLESPKQLNPDTPKELSILIDRLLAKSADDRPAGAAEVVTALHDMEQTAPAAVGSRNIVPPRNRSIWLGIGGAIIGFLAAFVIQWSTDRGTLVVDVADDALAVTFEKDSLRIKSKDSGEELTLKVGPNKLPSGDYEILVQSPGSKFELSMSEFALVRGSTKRLNVAWKRPPSSVQKPVFVGDVPAIDKHEIDWSSYVEELPVTVGDPVTESALVRTPEQRNGIVSWSAEPRLHRDSVKDIAMHPDGSLIATSGVDGMIRIWDMSWKLLEIIPAHDGRIGDLTWSNSGKVLASYQHEGDIRLWSIGAGKKPSRLLRRIRRRATAIAFSPDDSILAFTEDETHFWSFAENKVIPRLGISGRMPSDPWSPDGRLFLTQRESGYTIWDFESRKPLETISRATRTAGWSRTSPHLAVVNIRVEDNQQVPMIDIWNVERFERERTIRLGPHLDQVVSRERASWSPDGKHFLVARTFGKTREDGHVRLVVELWDAVNPDAKPTVLIDDDHASTRWSWGRSWTRDGQSVAIRISDRALTYDFKTKSSTEIEAAAQPVQLLENGWRNDKLLAFTVSPDGLYDRTVLWDMKSLKPIQSDFGERLVGATLSPDGSTVATVHLTPDFETQPNSARLELKVTRASDGKTLTAPLVGHSGIDFQWSNDGKLLAVINRGVSTQLSGRVRAQLTLTTMIDALNLKNLGQIKDTGSQRFPIFRWAPDGKHFAVLRNSNVEVINTSTKETVQEIAAKSMDATTRSPFRQRFSGFIGDIEWSPDGKQLMLGVTTQRPADGPDLPALDKYSNRDHACAIETWKWSGDELEYVAHQFIVQNTSRANHIRPKIVASPDGQLLAFHITSHLFAYDPATKKTHECEVPELTAPSGSRTSIEAVQWIDNSTVVFRRATEVFRWKPGNKIERITVLPSNSGWTLNGNEIAVMDGTHLRFYDVQGNATRAMFFRNRFQRAIAIDDSGAVTSGDANDVVYPVISSSGDFRTLTQPEFETWPLPTEN